MVLCCEMVHGVVALTEGYRIIIDDIQRIDCWEVFLRCYRHSPLIYCLCGIMGPWVKVPKDLEEDTPIWVYGVGLAFGYESQKIGYDLPLGDSPRIVIIMIEYLVQH